MSFTLFDGLPADQWCAGWNAFKQNGTYTADNGVKVDAIYSPHRHQTNSADGSDPEASHHRLVRYNVKKHGRHQLVAIMLNVRLSSDNTKYLASLELRKPGWLHYKNSATGYKQYDMRFDLDAKVNKYLNTSLELTAREEYRFFPTVGAGPIFRMLYAGVNPQSRKYGSMDYRGPI